MRRLILGACLVAGAAYLPVVAQEHGAPASAQKHAAEKAGEAHEGEHGGGNLDAWKWANFALLAGALGYFIAKKGGGFFGGRTAQIRQGLEDAARLKQESAARFAEMERRLANLGADVEALRRQAREESASEGDRLRRETESQLEKVKAQAGQEISAAAKAARQELRAYTAELAVGLAEGKIRERITPDVENALVESMASQLEARIG